MSIASPYLDVPVNNAGALTITQAETSEKAVVSDSALPVEELLNCVVSEYGIPLHVINGRVKTKSVSEARHICFWVLRTRTRMSFPEIAAAVGGRDHTSVINGVRRVYRDRERDRGFALKLSRVIARFEAAERALPPEGFDSGRLG